MAALLLAAAFSTGVRAATESPPSPALIDQQQTVNSSSFGTVTNGVFLAQSFVPSRSDMLGVALWITGQGNRTAKFEIGIYASLAPGERPVAPSQEAKGTVNDWLGVRWDEPLALKLGTTYFLVASDAEGSAFVFTGGSPLRPDDLYPAGQAFNGRIDDKTDQVLSSAAINGGARTWDLAFRTYAAPIPEPRSVALVLAGLVGLAAFLRRKRQASG